jgi:thiol-disulfide isomerase/thioredoxin
LLLCFGGAALYKYRKVQQFELARAMEKASKNRCDGKKFCTIVYVAPWCPACSQSIPVIDEFYRITSESSSLGMVTVIGQDSAQAMKQYAKRFKSPSIIDDGLYYRYVAGHGVPSWVVVENKTGKLIGRSKNYTSAQFIYDDLSRQLR